MIEDKELEDMQQMEISYKKECELHLQYEQYIIQKRLKFQRNCPHIEIVSNDYNDILNDVIRTTKHCKRCNKLIEVIEK